MIKKIIFVILPVITFYGTVKAVPADSVKTSLEYQNRKTKYISFSAGMGANYGNNKLLIDFIQYELPNYATLPETQKLADFNTGLEFFGGVEFQIFEKLSLKADYSYFIKSISSNQYPGYDFTYNSHQPYLMIYYIIPVDYIYFKLGGGAGYLVSRLTYQKPGGESHYSSFGLGLKCEFVFNAQISKSVAGYLSGSIVNTNTSNLKDNYNTELKTRSGGTVNLNSFGIGLRLGLEMYFFR